MMQGLRALKVSRISGAALLLIAGGCVNGTDTGGTGSADLGTNTAGIEGQMEVSVANFPDAALENYVLRTDAGEAFELRFNEAPYLATGDRVIVQGDSIADHVIQVNSVTPAVDDDGLGVVQQPLVGNAVRTRSKLAVLLVNWTAPDTQTVSGMRDKVFASTTSTREFYKENSYGLFDLSGDVFGWYTIPAPSGCDYNNIATNARAAARAAGVDIDSYTQTLYYFPRYSACGWSGLAYLGTPQRPARDTWYNGSSGCVVLAQELLHNFGARHSRSYTCSGAPLAASSSCSYSEYGDPFDPMGSGCFHINVYQKAAQGWFAKCNNVTVTSNGTFDVTPTETASNGIQSLRIPVNSSLCPSGTSSCYYYVEYRRPVGIFDSRSPTAQIFKGVMVHLAPSVDFTGVARPTNPYLLDMNPGTSSGHRDPALEVGRTFQDPNGIKITLVSAGTASAQVKVEFPNGGRARRFASMVRRPARRTPTPIRSLRRLHAQRAKLNSTVIAT